LPAQQRSIASFGDPTELARQFALVALVRQGRRAGGAALLAITLALLAMRARLAWYAAVHLALPDYAVPLAAWVGSFDRCMFWLAVVLAIAAWADLRVAGFPARFDPVLHKRLLRRRVVLATATVALLLSVCGDIVLTGLRPWDAELTSRHAVPLLTLAIEIACAAALAWRTRPLSRQARAALPS
jgi:hypothetical protein